MKKWGLKKKCYVYSFVQCIIDVRIYYLLMCAMMNVCIIINIFYFY